MQHAEVPMAPVMFEQIDAEITHERRSEAKAPPATPPNPIAIADQIRRELAVIEMRHSRLLAD
jgi:hypothetical protein